MDQREARNELRKGINLSRSNKPSEGISYLQKALEKFSDYGDVKRTAQTLLEIGKSYFQMNENQLSYDSYYNALELYKEEDDLIGQGHSYAGMALVEEKKKRYDESRKLYQNAINKFNKAKDYENESNITSHLASVMESQGAYQEALYEYERSIEINILNKNPAKELHHYGRIKNLKAKIKENSTNRGQLLILIGYLGLLIFGELVTTYSFKEFGLVIHFGILIALIVHSSMSKSYPYATLLRSMIVLPIIRIIGLTMPLMNIPTLYLFPIIAIPLFSSSIVLMRVQHITRIRVGLIWGNLRTQFAIAITGFFLGAIEFVILRPLPLIHTFDATNLIIGGIILLISTGLAEELLFRGIIQKNTEDILGFGVGLLYTSLLFTSLHIGWDSIIDLIFVFIVALFYGYAFQKTRSIFGITLSHGISNSILFLVMPFLVI